MKKLHFYFAVILATLGLFAGMQKLFFSLTDDFSYKSITPHLSTTREWEISTSPFEMQKACNALSQTYVYLASGSQSYAFASEDQKYVLKFFKNKRWCVHPLLESLPLTKGLEEKRERWIEKKREKLYATFSSCMISYREFKKETGILFAHLAKAPFPCTVVVKDSIGRRHLIPLGDVEFILQKRAIRTDQYLLTLRAKKDMQGAQAALSSLLNFTLKRAQKGYSDKDPHLIKNFGFIDGQGVEIDVGGFHRDPKKDLTYFRIYEIEEMRQKLSPWLNKNYPELVLHADQEFTRIAEQAKTQQVFIYEN